MIGVRFVDGTGAVVKNGGRVMKNVTGLDLVKLMAGSHGTLGVLTEVAFKVLPRPEATATLVLDGLDAATRRPGDARGARHALPGQRRGAPARARGARRCCGSRASPGRWRTGPGARAGARRLRRGAGRGGAGRLGGGARRRAPSPGATGAVWRISVKPTDGPPLGARLAPARGDLRLGRGAALGAGAGGPRRARGDGGHRRPRHAGPRRRGRQGALGRVPSRAAGGRGARRRAARAVRPDGRAQPRADGAACRGAA